MINTATIPTKPQAGQRRRLQVSFLLGAAAALQLAAAPTQEPPAGGPPAVDPQRAGLHLADLEVPALPAAEPGAFDETSDRARARLDEARALLDAQRYSEAQQQVSRALRYSPNSGDAHVLMAEAALGAGNGRRAAEHVQHALNLRPRDPLVHLLDGRAQLAIGAPGLAAAALRRVALCPGIEQAPDIHRLGSYYLGAALEQSGYLTAAAESFAAFLDTAGSGSGARHAEAEDLQLAAEVRCAELYARLGDPARAADVLAAATERGGRPEYWARIARWRRAAGQFDPAAEAARRRFELSGEDLQMLIDIRLEAGQRQRLVQDLQELASAHPQRYGVIEALVDLFVQGDDLEAGRDLLQSFVEAHPQDVKARAALAELLAASGQLGASLERLDAAILASSDPDALIAGWQRRWPGPSGDDSALADLQQRLQAGSLGAGAAYALGRLAADRGQLDLAVEALQFSAARAPEFLAAPLALGKLQCRRFAWEEAVATASRLVAASDGDFRTHSLLGQALLGLDRLDAAIDALLSAARLNRDDIPTREALVEAYTLRGERLSAVQQYRQILEIDPRHVEALETLLLLAMNEGDEHQQSLYLDRLASAENAAAARRAQALVVARRTQDWQAYTSALRAIAADHPEDLETHLQLAQQLAREDQFDAADAAIEAILQREPHHEPALVLQSVLAFQRFDYDGGLATLRKLLQMHPHRRTWQMALVQSLLTDHRFQEAAGDIARFLEDPDLDDRTRGALRDNLLLALALGDQVPQAIEQVRGWLAQTPGEAGLRGRLLDLSRLAGGAADLISENEAWYRAAEPDQRDDARDVLLETYLAAGRPEDAVVLTLSMLEIDPDAPSATFHLLHVLQRAGRYDEALAWIEAAGPGERNPQVRDALQRLALALYTEAGRYDDAARAVRDQLAGDDEDWALQRQLVWILVQNGKAGEALREIELWEQQLQAAMAAAESAGGRGHTRDGLREALTDIHSLRSLCYQENDQGSLAMQEQERRWQLEPDSAATCNDFSYQLACAGIRLDEAESLATRAARTNPREAAYLDTLGWVRYKQGRFEDARHWLGRAARSPSGGWDGWLRSPEQARGGDDAVIQDHLGDTAWRLGQREEAIGHWQRAVLLAGRESGYRSPEVRRIVAHNPDKIAAAAGGEQPACAEAPGGAP